MAHFAQLDENNVVLQVIVVSNDAIENKQFPESENDGILFCQSLFGANTLWKQTSYSASFRKNYAGVSYTYNIDLDAFVSPKPFESWILNTETIKWEAPVPYPSDGGEYLWNEDNLAWEPIVIEALK